VDEQTRSFLRSKFFGPFKLNAVELARNKPCHLDTPSIHYSDCDAVILAKCSVRDVF
jgi:hypothetical protein